MVHTWFMVSVELYESLIFSWDSAFGDQAATSKIPIAVKNKPQW
jgi:hypothetical protein